jgi:cobalt-precorrin 5A hydrolase/precorrin-3B C17-methyltransferase
MGGIRAVSQLAGTRCDAQIKFDSMGNSPRSGIDVRKALELASQGAKVALISSGDSGIYGMAGLALELWLQKPEATRPHFQVHPGISALQLAAAKAGAPLMHDFCTISLSDRLTPWDVIERRIQGAGVWRFRDCSLQSTVERKGLAASESERDLA